MQIHFESNLKHQTDAIDSVAKLFEGSPYVRPEDKFRLGKEWGVSKNILNISLQDVQVNVAKIANNHGITDYHPTNIPDFSIEMETGTGKTYVYIRTIFQLYKQYGLHKFIIVVPSVAIREGVLATLRDTKNHFQEIYNISASITEYNSKKIIQVRDFCQTNNLSIMVMNKQSFDKDSNIINASNRDNPNIMAQLQGVEPIIIMDEPQEGMDSDNMQERLSAFNPLFKLRYSATHKHPKNVIYRLTPYDAYNYGLVKKISVLSIHETNTQSNVNIKFKKVNLSSKGKNPTATLLLNVRLNGGDIKEKSLIIKLKDDLEQKTNNPMYHGWKVENIGTTDIVGGEGYVKFTNGETIKEGSEQGTDKETIFRQQIYRTIQTHFQRKDQLLPLGIKPLALFFIDKVANYVDEQGLIRRIFKQEYTQLYKQKYGKKPTNIDAIHNGYFAKTSKGDYTDNARSMEGEASKEIYNKILKDKTTLLNIDEPLEFIFSHSALGVGWDNPNVFTICTLNESISQIKKRQEIGRGLRICVNQNGERHYDKKGVVEGKEINRLTVIPNDSYHNFVTTYQAELQEEMGIDAKAPKMRNENKQIRKITRNNQRFTSADFKNLWQKISTQTSHKIYFREQTLIDEGVKALQGIVISKNEIQTSLHHVSNINTENIDSTLVGSTTTKARSYDSNLDLIHELARSTALARTTVFKIWEQLPIEQIFSACQNPMQFLAEATKKLRKVVADEMVRLVVYKKTDKQLSADELFQQVEETKSDTTATPDKGLYDYIKHDSDIEQDMAIEFDNNASVKLFFKLPDNYKIPTPIGNYTPDFALVMEKKNLDNNTDAPTNYYFVIETKGTDDIDKLKPDEKLKIQCAIKHFEAIGLRSYLAPVHNTTSFDKKSYEQTQQTFFNL